MQGALRHLFGSSNDPPGKVTGKTPEQLRRTKEGVEVMPIFWAGAF